MSRPIKRILAGAGGLLLGLSTPLLAVQSYAPALEPNQANAYSSQQLSQQQLLQLARAITVKVLSEQGWGSGILVEKQGASYKVLTNDHVLGRDRSRGWQIQTPDGKIHRGELVRTVRLNDYDLGLVSFRSSQVYSIADLANVD
ncbi:MAG: trypsin-like peptidase domain-containing protein, partial [Microcystis sp.]|uniref:trypsin-like peptidase domain-containing protein n=1 Tax=Microcystis sp. TaxID=1127 RepID=UPI003919F42D